VDHFEDTPLHTRKNVFCVFYSCHVFYVLYVFKYFLTFYHDLRKYYLSARIVNIWNSLPNYVVDVSTINQYKARLDKFWMHQDVLYDYTADLTGIGDRSVHETNDV